MKILVSACLLGVNCRYDGTGQMKEKIKKLMSDHQLVPVCPELLGGLKTPRCPAERQGNRVVTREGEDVTAAYRRGAEETLKLGKLFGCSGAILKERSPSCGCGKIYDGTFTKTLTDGDGVTAALLKAYGIPVFGDEHLEGENG